jgi:hypothetical protein
MRLGDANAVAQHRRSPAASLRPRSLAVAQHLVESRSLAHLMVALSEVGRVVGCVGIEAGSELQISVLLVEICGDRIAPRDVLVDRSECRQSRESAPRFADGDGTVEPDDWSVGADSVAVKELAGFGDGTMRVSGRAREPLR